MYLWPSDMQFIILNFKLLLQHFFCYMGLPDRCHVETGKGQNALESTCSACESSGVQQQQVQLKILSSWVCAHARCVLWIKFVVWRSIGIQTARASVWEGNSIGEGALLQDNAQTLSSCLDLGKHILKLLLSQGYCSCGAVRNVGCRWAEYSSFASSCLLETRRTCCSRLNP